MTKTSTNCKGLSKCSRQKHKYVPILKIHLEDVNLEQLYSFSEYNNPAKDQTVDNGEGKVDYSMLPKTGPYMEDDIPHIRSRLFSLNVDVLSGVQEALSPLCKVNHKITLIDKKCKYHYYIPQCPDGLKTQLSDKLGRYTRAQWWVYDNASQAAPMLCIPKKNGTLRTIVDYCQ